jgi:hypothetical protein
MISMVMSTLHAMFDDGASIRWFSVDTGFVGGRRPHLQGDDAPTRHRRGWSFFARPQASDGGMVTADVSVLFREELRRQLGALWSFRLGSRPRRLDT